MNREIIALENVKTYRADQCVLEIESLHVSRGELVAVIGPNGSGKSTLLQVLNSLLPVRQGLIRVLGVSLASADAVQLRRRVAMVFQEPLFIHDTVYANVALPLRFRGQTEETVREKVNASLGAFRCDHLAQRLAHRLSGGEAQRVRLARAFVTEPEVVLLDEPFSAIDPATRNDLLAELKTAALARQATVLLVSHSLEEVLRFAQRTVVLQGGRIVQDALPEAILRRPVNPVVARLAGMDNMWPCQVAANGGQGNVRLDDRLVFSALGGHGRGQAWCCLPGDSFRIVDDSRLPGEGWILLEAQVEEVIPGIGVAQVQARSGTLPLTMKLAGDTAAQLTAGQRITVAFQQSTAHILPA